MKVLKSAERFGKKFLTQLIKIFIKQEILSANSINPSSINRIIIIHLDRKVGNLILSTPLIESTKKYFVNASVDILVAHQVKVLLESNPYLSNIFEFSHSGFIRNPFKLFQLISFLRKRNYTVAIESSNPSGTSFLNGFITFLTAAKYRIGFSGGGGELFTNIHIKPNKNNHYYLAKQELVNLFSNNINTFKPKIYINPLEVEELRNNILSKFNLMASSKLVGIWIGARDKKKWIIDNFISVYNKIKIETDYIPFLLFGVEETKDFNNIDKGKYNSISFSDLKELKNFISCCDIFISGDTGPLHYSYALNVSTIGIFLQDNYDTYGYNSEGNNFIVKPDRTEKMIEDILKVCKTLGNKKISK